MVTALMIRPGEHPWPTLLADDSDFLNCAVNRGWGTFYTAMARRVEPGIAVLYANEAAIMGGIGNRKVNGRIYADTIYIVGHKDGALVSLTDDAVAKYTMLLWEPEQYTEDEIIDSYLLE